MLLYKQFNMFMENPLYIEIISCVFLFIMYFYERQDRIRIATKTRMFRVNLLIIAFSITSGIFVQLFFPNLPNAIFMFFKVIAMLGVPATIIVFLLFLYFQTKRLSRDYLTDVSTRQVFTQALDLRLNRHKTAIFSVMVFSLREFKRVNHKFGQHNGDRLLQDISEYLKTVCKCSGNERLYAMHSHSNSIYRYSGDQFAVIFDNDTGKESLALAKIIELRLAEPWKIGDEYFKINAVMGIVQCPEIAETKECILNGIECSLTTAKNDKCHLYSFCTLDMLSDMKRKADITEIIKGALTNDLFEVVYQPILSVETHCYSHAESLLRLHDTPLGNISPGEFIPIAEETGLIAELTFYELEKICKYIKQTIDSGIRFQGITLNLSSVMLMRDDLTARFLRIIDQSEIPSSKIIVEITESALIENLEMVQEFISVLASRGIAFALDDFGTGFSNLSMVLHIPFQIIKFDKSLVWGAMHSNKTAAIIRHLTWAFQEINIDVLVEGVETVEQNGFVTDCGCDMIQGFFYAKPMSANELTQLFSIQSHAIADSMRTYMAD